MDGLSMLCGLFDTVAYFGNLVERSNDKDDELAILTATVESVSASVQAFAADLRPEERAPTFHSNKVFPELMEHMKKCEEVINKRCLAVQDEEARLQLVDQPHSNGTSAASAISRGVKDITNGIGSTMRAALESLEGKVGKRLGKALQLPEDELETIRSVSAKTQRLVPLLNLAITAHTSRGRKRLSVGSDGSSFVETDEPDQPDQKRVRGPQAILDASGSKPNVFLQLVSDAKEARSLTLPTLVVSDLREGSLSKGGSSSSLETTGDPGISPKRLFGRQEVRDKVPSSFMLPVQEGTPPQPVNRFVSRDLFELEEKNIATMANHVEGSLYADTLQLGDNGILGGTDDAATLAMGPDNTDTLALGGSETVPQVGPLTLAIAKSGKNGFHYRQADQSPWQWIAPDVKQDLHEGDRIALILESPRGTYMPAPQRSLEAADVTCLLGVEIRLPKLPVAPF